MNANDINNSGRNILDYASDSSSEDEPTTLGNTWRGYEMDNSDNESVDSEADDPLKCVPFVLPSFLNSDIIFFPLFVGFSDMLEFLQLRKPQ